MTNAQFPSKEKVHLFYEDVDASQTTDWASMGPSGPGLGNWAGREEAQGGLGFYGEFGNWGDNWGDARYVTPDVSAPRVEENLADYSVPPFRRLATLGMDYNGGTVMGFHVCDNRGVVGQDADGILLGAGEVEDGSVQFCDPEEFPSRACGVWIEDGGYVSNYQGGPVYGMDLRACVATVGVARRNPDPDMYHAVVFDDAAAGASVLVDTNVVTTELLDFSGGVLALRMVRVAVDTFIVVYIRDGEMRSFPLNPDFPDDENTYFFGTACARVIRTNGLTVSVGPRVEVAQDCAQVDIVALDGGRALISYARHESAAPEWASANWRVARADGMGVTLGAAYQQKPPPPGPIPAPTYAGINVVSGTTVNFSGVQDGDFCFLQASAGSGAALLGAPTGWNIIVRQKGFQHNLLLAWRIWHTGDATAVTVTNAYTTAVARYRSVAPADQGYVSFQWWNTEVGGSINVPNDALVIDCMFNESLSTFTPVAPAGETKRHGQVNGGHGMALADTSGSTVPPGLFDPPIWTDFTESTGTTVGIMVSLKLFPPGVMVGDVVDPQLIAHAAVVSPGTCVLGYEYQYLAISGVTNTGFAFYHDDLEIKFDRVTVNGLTITPVETEVDFPTTNDGVEGFAILGLSDDRMIVFCEGWEGRYRTSSDATLPTYGGFVVEQGHSTLYRVDSNGFEVIDRSSDDDWWIDDNAAAFLFSENVAAVVSDGQWYLEFFEGIPKNVHDTAMAALADDWFVVAGGSRNWNTGDPFRGRWDSEPFTISVGGVTYTRYGETVRGELRAVHVDGDGNVDIVGKAFVSHWRGQFELPTNYALGGAFAGVTWTGTGRQFLLAYHGSNVRAGQTAVVHAFNSAYNHPGADTPDDNGPWVRLFDVADDGAITAMADPVRLPLGIRAPLVTDNIDQSVTTMFVWTRMSPGVFLLTYQGIVSGADVLLSRIVRLSGQDLTFGPETIVASPSYDLRHPYTRFTGVQASAFPLAYYNYARWPPFAMERISNTAAIMLCVGRSLSNVAYPGYSGAYWPDFHLLARGVELGATNLTLGPMIEPPDYVIGATELPYKMVMGNQLVLPVHNLRNVPPDTHTPTQSFPNDSFQSHLIFATFRLKADLSLEVALNAPEIDIGTPEYPDNWVQHMWGPMLPLNDSSFAWVGRVQMDPQGRPAGMFYDAVNFPINYDTFVYKWSIAEGVFSVAPEIDFFGEGEPWPELQAATGENWTLVVWGGGQAWNDPGSAINARDAKGSSYGGGPIWGRVMSIAGDVARGVLSISGGTVGLRARSNR